MTHYGIIAFFQTYPKAKEAFETYDGILHPTKPIAETWVARHANKTIITHQNPDLKKAAEGDGVTVKTAKTATEKKSASKGETGQKKVVTPKDEKPNPAQLTIPEGGETPNPENGKEPEQ